MGVSALHRVRKDEEQEGARGSSKTVGVPYMTSVTPWSAFVAPPLTLISEQESLDVDSAMLTALGVIPMLHYHTLEHRHCKIDHV